MSKLTKAIRRLSPITRFQDPGLIKLYAEDVKALDTLLTQIKSDRRQISQLNEKHMEQRRQFKNLNARGAYERLVRDKKIEELTAEVEDFKEGMKARNQLIDQISADRTYWQGEARRLEGVSHAQGERLAYLEEQQQVPNTSSSEYVDPVQQALDQQHVAFHEAAKSVMGHLRVEPTNERLLRQKEEAEEKLSRIAEIIGTTDVPEKTIRNYASTGFTAAQLLSELLAAKVEAVAGILDED